MNQQQLAELQRRNKATGDRGEDYVLALERKRLAGHPLLAQVKVVGRYDVGLGYDIASFESLESRSIDRYIEVKTYNGNPHFFLSQSEYAAAEKFRFSYYLYLVDEARIDTPDYLPTIIRNPVENLDTDIWQQRLQQREYTLVDDSMTFPEDFDDSTVLIGCYNDNHHIDWIKKCSCYNVRSSEVSTQYGAVSSDAVSTSVGYLLLYNVQVPRLYSFYRIDKCKQCSRAEMQGYGYHNPHAPYYMLYHMAEKVQLPPIDIMKLLRASNDKVQRTSGTPIFMQGISVRRFCESSNHRPGISAPRCHYSNEGKPWTEVQDIKLTDWIHEGRDTAYIALRLYRSSQDVEQRRKLLGL